MPVACASCHKQAFAFAEPVAKSNGFSGGLTTRNSMGLTDAKYYPNGKFLLGSARCIVGRSGIAPDTEHRRNGHEPWPHWKPG